VSDVDIGQLASQIVAELAGLGTPERARQEKAYLKSDLVHYGVAVPAVRRVDPHTLVIHATRFASWPSESTLRVIALLLCVVSTWSITASSSVSPGVPESRLPSIAPSPHQVSTNGRRFPVCDIGGGADRKAWTMRSLECAGSMTSSISKCSATLSAFPCA